MGGPVQGWCGPELHGGPALLSLQDGDTEVAADLLFRGHVPASVTRQHHDQPLGHLLLLHREQVNDGMAFPTDGGADANIRR